MRGDSEIVIVADLEDWPCRWDYEFGRRFMRRRASGWTTFALALLVAGVCEGFAHRGLLAARVASLRTSVLR